MPPLLRAKKSLTSRVEALETELALLRGERALDDLLRALELWNSRCCGAAPSVNTISPAPTNTESIRNEIAPLLSSQPHTLELLQTINMSPFLADALREVQADRHRRLHRALQIATALTNIASRDYIDEQAQAVPEEGGKAVAPAAPAPATAAPDAAAPAAAAPAAAAAGGQEPEEASAGGDFKFTDLHPNLRTKPAGVTGAAGAPPPVNAGAKAPAASRKKASSKAAQGKKRPKPKANPMIEELRSMDGMSYDPLSCLIEPLSPVQSDDERGGGRPGRAGPQQAESDSAVPMRSQRRGRNRAFIKAA